MGKHEPWYVYVILCENRLLFSGITLNVKRRLKEQFSGGKRTSKFLLENRPACPIRKFKCRDKKSARQASECINQLNSEGRKEYILDSFMKNKQPYNWVKVSDKYFGVYCNECGFTSTLKCRREDLEVESIRFRCVHKVIKEKIDALFEQALLGACCFHNGRFMFEGRKKDQAIDFLLGFSGRQHKKRTMAGYDTLDEISFKNSYLLLSVILEEVYYLIKYYTADCLDSKSFGDYQAFSFKKGDNDFLKQFDNIRFCQIAHFVRQVANVLKHTGGIIKNERSGKKLIEEFNLEEGLDLITYRNYKNIKGTSILIGNIRDIIARLYVFIIDLVASIFKFRKFRIRHTAYSNIEEEIVNYNVRNAYRDFLRVVQKDGSVIFLD